ncbi:MAG: hypothetical protein ACFFDK_05785 [Promethearchaeota archaeon]
MAKKKRETASDSLASALKQKKRKQRSGKSTESDLEPPKQTQEPLQSLLQGVSEGKGFYRRELKKEQLIEPQLSYDSKTKIAEDYLMEEIPISERATKVKDRTPLVDGEASQTKEVVKSKGKIKESVSKSIREDIYEKLGIFFTEYLNGSSERYNRWENSVGNILSILRKMRKFTKKNTEDLIDSINNQFKKIELNLQEFKVKRDEIERIAGVDILTMSGEFKKVLGLLELQIKEYQLKRLTDEFIHQQELYSQF